MSGVILGDLLGTNAVFGKCFLGHYIIMTNLNLEWHPILSIAIHFYAIHFIHFIHTRHS